MRMWMVTPALMCRQHLLGEHRELHALVGMIQKDMWSSLRGLADDGLIDLLALRSRHEELVEEMRARGYGHYSPLPDDFEKDILRTDYWVDEEESLEELSRRCKACAEKIEAPVLWGAYT